MTELVTTCPRCGADQITHDLNSSVKTRVAHHWQQWYEAFCVCRKCARSTIYVLADKGTTEAEELRRTQLEKVQGCVNKFVRVEGHINFKDVAAVEPPEHPPNDVASAFEEGAKCLATGCHNAAGTMFRLCVDLATRPILPKEETPGLNSKTRRDLGLRLPWLFDNGHLPAGLRELSTCIKEEGNDGAHAGTLSKEDAEDALDFTRALLERLYTEPERLKEAARRREARRRPQA